MLSALPRDTMADLLATCAVAPANEASAAVILLAREMVARLECGDFEVRLSRDGTYSGPYNHLAYKVLEIVPTQLLTLGQLLYVNPEAQPENRRPIIWGSGFADEADFFLYAYRSFGGGFPRPPLRPLSYYSAVCSYVMSLATELRALVIEAIGSTAFDAARALYLNYFAWQDFNARVDVARYRVFGTAAPGAPFLLQSTGSVVRDYSLLSGLGTTQFAVPAAGTYHTRFHEVVRSDGTVNPTNVKVSLMVNGGEAGSYTESRASADPTEYVYFRHAPRVDDFGTVVDITVGDGDLLTVVNGGAFSEYAAGCLMIWRDA